MVRNGTAGTLRVLTRPALRSRAPCRQLFHGAPARASGATPDAAVPSPSGGGSSSSSSQRVTIAEIYERRARAGRLVAPTAAYSDSDMFKAPLPPGGKPRARRWDHLVSAESAARQPCVLKQAAARHLKKPGLISLGGGLPHPAYFPFEELGVRVPLPPDFSPGAAAATMAEVRVGKFDTAVPGGTAEYDLAIALNYGQATGSAQLMRWVTEHTELVCHPPYADWRCCLTVGSTGALEQALRLFCDRGDGMLTEEFSFATALETAAPLGIPVFGVRMDEQGLLPESMDAMLTGWDPRHRGGAPRPRLLYTVPSGQNPTGATQGEQRRRDIYDVCRRHDVYILEDEPYYFLQMEPYGANAAEKKEADQTTVDGFLDSLIPSLLSMDVDGRVLRMDSFSKVLVPGSRLGWVTASEQIIERYIRHSEVCNQGPSGFSQAVLHKLLDETWGHDGYLRWLMHLRHEYTGRRDAMLQACEEFLPRDIVSWEPPAAGLFVSASCPVVVTELILVQQHWLKVNYELHPDAPRRSILDLEDEIFNLCIDNGVLVGRGSWFMAEQDKPPTGLYFRATFAAATPENMAEAIRRFGAAVRRSYRLS